MSGNFIARRVTYWCPIPHTLCSSLCWGNTGRAQSRGFPGAVEHTLVSFWYLRGSSCSCGISCWISSLLGCWIWCTGRWLSCRSLSVLTVPWVSFSAPSVFHIKCVLAASSWLAETTSISTTSKNIDFFFYLQSSMSAGFVASCLSNNWIWLAWLDSYGEITRKLREFRDLSFFVS